MKNVIFFVFGIMPAAFGAEIKYEDIKSVQLMNHSHRAQDILIEYTKWSSEWGGGLLDDVAIALEKVNLQLKQKDQIGIIVVGDKKYDKNYLQHLSPKIPRGMLSKIRFFGIEKWNQDKWMQDVGEFMVADLGTVKRPFFLDVHGPSNGLDMGYQGISQVLPEFSRFIGHTFYQNPVEVGTHGYGGNIEATPNDLLVTSNLPASLKKFFEEKGYKNKITEIDSTWVDVNHVDEFFSTIPIKSQYEHPGSSCGFAIVRHSAVRGREVLKSVSAKSLADIPKRYIILEGEMDTFDYKFFLRNWATYNYQSGNKEPFRSLTEADSAYHDSGYLNSFDPQKPIADLVNQKVIDKKIDREIEILKKRIAEVTPGCTRPREVEIPAIFICGGEYSQNVPEKIEELFGCRTILPNPVNLISLGEHNLVPDPFISEYRESIRNAFKEVGHQVHFVDTSADHETSGDAHCLTNVIRKQEKYFSKK